MKFAPLFNEASRLPRAAGRGLVAIYRYTLSPLIGFNCRHLPTCSQFADEALARHGLWAGGWMTLGRLSRCHPFGTSGLDFVPARVPAGARWFMPWRYARWSWRQTADRAQASAKPDSHGSDGNSN
jgi:putative membrane protein insertion efficiency factor